KLLSTRLADRMTSRCQCSLGTGSRPAPARREKRCGGSKLKAYELHGPGGVDGMMLVEKPVPAPGPGQGAGEAEGCDHQLSRSPHGEGRLWLAAKISAGATVRWRGRGGKRRRRCHELQGWRPRDRQLFRGLARRRAERGKDAL